MRVCQVTSLLMLMITLGFTFRISQFIEDLTNSNKNEHERQADSTTAVSGASEINAAILPIFVITFLANLITSLLSATIVEEEFSWCYEGSCGPEYWGDHYETCKGTSQSPIDIISSGVTQVAETTALSFASYDQVRVAAISNSQEHYNRYGGTKGDTTSSDGTLKNNGHTVQLDVSTPASGVGTLSGGPLSGSYQILQLHFHWGSDDTKGSEHTLDGQEFPLEMHIVHTKDGEEDPLNTPMGLAVTGFFFEIDSSDNAALVPIIDALSSIANADIDVEFSNSGFRLDQLIDGVAPISGDTTPYSTYSGSLTTPTCNEVVHWINFLTPLKISSSQLESFRTLLDDMSKPIVDNYRPPQPLNGRTVDFYQAM